MRKCKYFIACTGWTVDLSEAVALAKHCDKEQLIIQTKAGTELVCGSAGIYKVVLDKNDPGHVRYNKVAVIDGGVDIMNNHAEFFKYKTLDEIPYEENEL